MPWQNRGNTSYYYQSRWINGRNKTVYVGTGRMAELIALADEREAAEKREARAELERLKTLVDKHKEAIQASRELSKTVLDAAMVASGYYQNKRQWRKNVRTNNKHDR